MSKTIYDYLTYPRRLLEDLRSKRPNISDEDLHDYLMRQQLREKRRLMRRRHGGDIAADRFARKVSRRLKKKTLARHGLPNGRFRGAIPKKSLLARFRPSPILDALIPKRREKWANIARRSLPSGGKSAAIKMRNFDMLRNAEDSLGQIIRIGEAEGSELVVAMDFEDQKCLDAGAYLVLAEFWPQLNDIIAGGAMSLSVQKVLAGIGIDKALGLRFNGSRNLDDVWPFTIRQRRTEGTTSDPDAFLHPQDSDKVTRDFVELVDEWLSIPNDPKKQEGYGYELTGEGKGNISDIIGELTCNAERYGNPETPDDGDWSMTAFMVRRLDEQTGKHDLLCHMAFLSVGQSIAESLRTASSNVTAQIGSYTKLHARCGLSQDTLATVVALQDTVTGNAAADHATRGGMGLQDVLKVVDELADYRKSGTRGEVTIVSGNSCIQLAAPNLFPASNPKLRGPLDGLDGQFADRRLHWCNDGNNREAPPDPQIVKDLKHRLAGTLVTVAFALDNDYVGRSRVTDDDNGTN